MSTSDRRIPSSSHPRTRRPVYAGVDVGADRLNAVLISPAPTADPASLPAADPAHGADPARWAVTGVFTGGPEGLVSFCSGAPRVGVDAPGGLSCGVHLGDASVAPKFRTGRCSEVPVAGWPAVSWVTPQDEASVPGWMRTGFAVWRTLLSGGFAVVETFPAAAFHRLNGRRWPPRKSTPEGRAARLSLLSELVDLPVGADRWTHDDIDAAACALVAAAGQPLTHCCPEPDGSVMWVIG